MSNRVDARDVLDANATTKRPFRGRIVGHYRPTGPNSWDPYEQIRREEGEIDVHAGVRVQAEDYGAQLRMRDEGRVVRVRWIPSEEEKKRVERRYDGDHDACFLAELVEPFESSRLGAAAVIARKLRS